MSCYTASTKQVDLRFLEARVQESLDNGFDDDEVGITELLRYYLSDPKNIQVKFLSSCGYYSIKFSMMLETYCQDAKKHEYQYGFFVKSRKNW